MNTPQQYSIGGLVIEPESLQVIVRGERRQLTRAEMAVLVTLVSKQERIVSYYDLMSSYKEELTSRAAVRKIMSRVRKAIRPHHRMIINIYGMGYMFTTTSDHRLRMAMPFLVGMNSLWLTSRVRAAGLVFGGLVLAPLVVVSAVHLGSAGSARSFVPTDHRIASFEPGPAMRSLASRIGGPSIASVDLGLGSALTAVGGGDLVAIAPPYLEEFHEPTMLHTVHVAQDAGAPGMFIRSSVALRDSGGRVVRPLADPPSRVGPRSREFPPASIASLPDGSLVMSDFAGMRVLRVSRGGETERVLAIPPGLLATHTAAPRSAYLAERPILALASLGEAGILVAMAPAEGTSQLLRIDPGFVTVESLGRLVLPEDARLVDMAATDRELVVLTARSTSDGSSARAWGDALALYPLPTAGVELGPRVLLPLEGLVPTHSGRARFVSVTREGSTIYLLDDQSVSASTPSEIHAFTLEGDGEIEDVEIE